MATVVAETDIRGRLGTYTLTIYDKTDTATTITPFSIDEDVVITYGEQSRDYPEQVLKSYTQITVRDGADEAEALFSGSFDSRDYPVRIVGPGTDWLGFVEPEERQQPFGSRIVKNSASLLISDGISQANQTEDAGFVVGSQRYAPVRTVERSFAVGPRSVSPLPFTETHNVRFDGTFTDVAGTRYDATTFATSDDIAVCLENDRSGIDNFYDLMIRFLALMRGRIYRSLSDRTVLLHALRETGAAREYAEWDPTANNLSGGLITADRPEDVATITADDVLEPFDRAFQDLEAAGKIIVNLDDYDALGRNKDSDYNLARGGLSEITDDPSQTGEILDLGSPSFTDLQYVLNDDAGSSSLVTVEVAIGRIDPIEPLGVRVTWDVEVVGASSPSLTVEVDYNEGFTDPVATETNGDTVFELDAPVDTDAKDVVVRFEGNDVIVTPRVQFYREDQIIETLVISSERSALQNVEVPFEPMPMLIDGVLIAPTPVNTTVAEFDPGTDTSGTGDGSSVASVRRKQPWQVRAELEAAYRPYGARHCQVRLDGIYGPETALIIEKPDGTSGFFICGTGREISLKDGTTQISDVEIPSALLPSDLSALL